MASRDEVINDQGQGLDDVGKAFAGVALVLSICKSPSGWDKFKSVLQEENRQNGKLPILAVVASFEGEEDLIGCVLILRYA